MTDASRDMLALAGSQASRLVAGMTEEEASSPLGIFVAGLATSVDAHMTSTPAPEDDSSDAERRRDALRTRSLVETAAFGFRMAPALVSPKPEPEVRDYFREVANLVAEQVLSMPFPKVDDRTVDVDRLLEALQTHLILSEVLLGKAEDDRMRGLDLGRHRAALEKTIDAARRIENPFEADLDDEDIQTFAPG